jgi:glyoxylate reductase
MSQMKILVTLRLPEEVLARLTRALQVEAYDQDPPLERQRLLRRVSDKVGLLCTITDRIDAEVLDQAPALKVIANYGVGFEHIDVEAATRRGIPVTNTPGVLTDSTADLTLALILATARRVVEGDRRVREGKFQYWAPLLFLGTDVSGKTLGLIGLGRIGQAVAQRAAGFGMKLIYYSRTRLKPAREQELQVSYAPLETLLREADFVSLHVPLTPQTRHLISSRELQLMKPSAYFINTARGWMRPPWWSPCGGERLAAPVWTSMNGSRPSPPAWPTWKTSSSCRMWAAPPLRPAPRWPRWRRIICWPASGAISRLIALTGRPLKDSWSFKVCVS